MGKYREQPWERSLIVNLVFRDESRCGALDNAREIDPGMFKVTHRGLDLEVSWGKKILDITFFGHRPIFGSRGSFVCLATSHNSSEIPFTFSQQYLDKLM